MKVNNSLRRIELVKSAWLPIPLIHHLELGSRHLSIFNCSKQLEPIDTWPEWTRSVDWQHSGRFVPRSSVQQPPGEPKQSSIMTNISPKPPKDPVRLQLPERSTRQIHEIETSLLRWSGSWTILVIDMPIRSPQKGSLRKER